MNQQNYDYDPRLSAHFINLALAAEAQCNWETSAEGHEELENPFAIPLECYDEVFRASGLSGETVKADVEGPIQDEYDFVGSIRVGEQPVADYEESAEEETALSDVEDVSTAILDLVSDVTDRVTESIGNTVRYNLSNLLMGFALRSKVDGHGLIVLRGTMTASEWLSNFSYQLSPFLADEDLACGKVHLGFRNVYKGIRGRYRELAAEFAIDKPLYLVGHSLGGAVSAIGALDVVQQQPERSANIQAYLYATPRTGDETFAQVYNAQVGTSYRIVNVCDLVPFIPFEEVDALSDALTGYPYTDTKGQIAYVHQAGNLVTNHVESYHLATSAQIPGVMDATVPQILPVLTQPTVVQPASGQPIVNHPENK